MNLPEPLPPAEQAHCRRTAALSEMLAKLAGLPDSEVRRSPSPPLSTTLGRQLFLPQSFVNRAH